MAVRDRLITSAIARMRRDGVAATGISELIADAGVARRSVYLNFPGGKAELLTEATTAAGRFISEAIAALVANHSPAEAVSAFAEQWRRDLISADFDAGCPIVAAALGRSQAPAAADVAGRVFTEWSTLLAEGLQRVGVDTGWAADLAHTAIATIEGAVLMCVASRSTEPLHHAERVLTHLVDTAGGTQGTAVRDPAAVFPRHHRDGPRRPSAFQDPDK